MNKNYLHIILSILLLGFGSYPANLKLIAKLNKIICQPNLKRIANTSCFVRAVNRYEKLGNAYGFLLQPTYFNNVNMKLYRRTNGWHLFLINFTEDICRFFKYGTLLPYMDIVYNLTKKFSNLNHSCPYKGPLVLKDANFNETVIFDIFPTGEYRANVKINEGRVLIGEMDFYYEVKKN